MAETDPQPPTTGSSGTFDQVQSQVNEVKVILKDNINKVLERGDRLDDLIGKTDDLQASVIRVIARRPSNLKKVELFTKSLKYQWNHANRLCVGLSPKIQDILKFVIPVQNVEKKEADSFQRTSTRVARKYWWKNIKMMIIIGVIVLIVLILIILAATKVI